MEVACVDPTLLSGTPVDMVMPAKLMKLGEGDKWEDLYHNLHTPFFAMPGMVTVKCVYDAHGGYLAVAMNLQDPGDQRPADMPGDLIVRGHLVYSWGLHLIDLNLVLGNLVDFVGAYDRAHQ